MDFRNGDTPWGDVGKVREVLEFLTYATSTPAPPMHSKMRPDEWAGLYWILLACGETLKHAGDAADK